MGGFGSGRRRNQATRTVEQCRCLDLTYINRRHLLTPSRVFSLSWTNSLKEVVASASFSVRGDANDQRAVSLEVIHPKPHYDIKLSWTACNYGGSRPWFVCPGCGRRVVKLYWLGGYFLCRHCHGLTYASKRHDAGDRALSKAQKIRRRLGGSASLAEPFPGKPPGMHWKTYQRLEEEGLRAERMVAAGLGDWTDKAARFVGKLE